MRRLSTIANDVLLEQLHVLVGSHRRVTADLVAHLGEVDARRLHVNKGFSSLFSYCVERLSFSEDEACRRIEAARLVRKFPEIYSHLESGSVSLTVLSLLKHHLTAENHRELLAGVSGLSVGQAKEWLAARFPLPDVPSSIRKLPERSAVQVASRRSAAAESWPASCASSAALLATTTAGLGTAASASSGAALDAVAPASGGAALDALAPASGGAAAPASGGAGLDALAPASGSAVAPAPGIAGLGAVPALAQVKIEPLSRDRFLVRFTASRAMREKLALACDLLRHANPSGDLSAVLERAIGSARRTVRKDETGAHGTAAE